MLEISVNHFLLHPELLIIEMRRRGCSGRIELRDGTYIVLEWRAAEAVNDPMYQTQGEEVDGQFNYK